MKALIFDVETSGLIANRTIKLAKQPEIIEFAAELVDLATGEIYLKADYYIRPKEPISEEITKITGITNDELKDKPPFSLQGVLIQELIERAPLVIAHNLSFDQEMIDIELERLGQKVKWPRALCTVEQTVGLKGYRLTLSNLHELLFGVTFDGAHRADVDVAALVRCCIELYKRGVL